MSLLQLPEELLRQIADDSRPQGFESLMLSCRTLYEAGKPYLKHHNRLRKRYSRVWFQEPPPPPVHINFGQHWGTGSQPFFFNPGIRTGPAKLDFLDETLPLVSVLQILHAMGRDPLVASYITTADFHDMVDSNTTSYQTRYDEGLAELQREIEATGSVLQLLKESEYIRPAETDVDEWYRRIISDGSWTLIFLMTLLTSIERLTLPAFWHDRHNLRKEDKPLSWQLLDQIVEKANSPHSANASLGRLRVLGSSMDVGYESKARFGDIAPFLAIKSLREVALVGGVAAQDSLDASDDFTARYDAIGPKVERLIVPGCCMDAENCTKVFHQMSSLRELHLSFETKWHGVGMDWEAGEFAESLMAEVGNTLQSLSFTVHEGFGNMSAVRSLKAFRELENLELDARLFMGSQYMDEANNAGQVGNYPRDVPRLIDVLPESLRTLRLCALSSPEYNVCLDGLFTDFAAERPSRFPKLNEVTLVRGNIRRQQERPQLPDRVGAARDTGSISIVEVDGRVKPMLIDPVSA